MEWNAICRRISGPNLARFPLFKIQEYNRTMITYKVEVDNRGTKRWYNEEDQLHRLDGPAVEWSDGDKWWYQKGKLHRLDGPAVEYSDGHKEWFQNDKLHRLDGPAIEWADGGKAWFIEGEQYNEEKFNAKIQSINRPCTGKKVVVDGVEYSLA
jgi:hypothetical protein